MLLNVALMQLHLAFAQMNVKEKNYGKEKTIMETITGAITSNIDNKAEGTMKMYPPLEERTSDAISYYTEHGKRGKSGIK